MTAAIPSLPSDDEEVSPKGNMLEGKKTYITTIFGIISGIIAILQGNSSLPEILQVLGDIVNILGFNPSNAGPAVIGFAAIATTRMSITKLLRIMQELWPIVQEIRKLAAEAKKK